MSSSINSIKCLIVEDDKFKLDSIYAFLRDVLPGKVEITACRALSTATSALTSSRFDLVIIDMSIPSHEPEAGAGSPFPLPNGGLDVLFEANGAGQEVACVVLTQYPDIAIEGVPVPVDLAAAEIELKFGIKVAGCVQYSESGTKWKMELSKVLEGL